MTTAPNSRRALKRLRSRGGYSLAELMITMIILALAGTLILQSFNLGIRQFFTRTRESEAQSLCNTLSLAMQEQLTYITEATVSGDTLTAFYSGAIPGMSGKRCTYVLGGPSGSSYAANSGGQILLQCGDQYYPLADYASYAGYASRNENDFIADWTIKAVKSGSNIDHFDVTITVTYKTDSWQAKNVTAAKNTFVVTPIRRDIAV